MQQQAIRTSLRITVAVTVLAFAAGCATQQQTNTAVGTGVGAAVGAGVGALVGNSTGALVGAGLGAVAGGLVGYNWSTVKQEVQQSGTSSLGIDVVEMPDGSLKVNIPGGAAFDSGKSVLKPELRPVLNSVAQVMAKHPELRLKAVGHTDSTGSAASNQILSEQRARAVTTYLTGQRVARSRMSTEGRGSNDPIGDNATEEGRAANRRVEVYLYATAAK